MKSMKTRSASKLIQENWLLLIMLAYCMASLIHFTHNAVFIDEYPNFPDSFSAAGVYIAWLGITGIGIVGYLLVHYGKRLVGLVTCAVYGAMGLDGLGHYTLAPISAHTFTMNFTIWLEAITAVIVLIVVAGLMINHFRGCPQSALE